MLKYVACTRRRSSKNSDAENLRRSAIVAPAVSAGTKFADSALPWNSGIEQYRTSSAPNGMRSPIRAKRPWVPRTALGAPVEPEVKIRTNKVSGPGSSLGTVASACRAHDVRHASESMVVDPVGADPEVEVVEERTVRRLGDDEHAVGVADVVRQLRAAPGRVDPDDSRARERGASQQEDVLGHVVEQDADVERLAVDPRVAEPRRRAPRTRARSRPTSTTGPRRAAQCGRRRRARRPAPRSSPVSDSHLHTTLICTRRACGWRPERASSVRASGAPVGAYVGEPREQLFEQHPAFEARERGTEAQVLAETEGEVLRSRQAGSRRTCRPSVRTRPRRGSPTRRA